MDAAESAGVTERGQATIATLVGRRTKAIAGIIAHRRSGSDGALNAGSPSGTAKGGIGRVDRLRSTAWVEEADVAGVILVHAQQGVGLDVAHEIDTQHHASGDLALDPNVHLHRTRRFVVGVKHGGARPKEAIGTARTIGEVLSR